MRKLNELLSFLMVLFFALFAHFSSACIVDPSEPIKMTFSIVNATGKETLFGSKSPSNSDDLVPIWTDNIQVNGAFIQDLNNIALGENYKVELIFTPGQGNKSGNLAYYLSDYSGNNFQFIGNYPADLKGIHPTQVLLVAGGVVDVACSGNITPPDIQPQFPEICDLFPEPAQSWNISSTGPYAAYGASFLNVNNGDTARIRGWSNAYRQQNLITKPTDWGNKTLLKTGFDSATDLWQIYTHNVCDSAGCEVGNADGLIRERKAKEPNVVIFKKSNAILAINGSNFSSVCTSNPTLCKNSVSGNKTNIEIVGNLKSLNVSMYGGATSELVVTFANNIHIESMTIGGSIPISTYFRPSSLVTFGTVIYSDGNLKLIFGHQSLINVKTKFELNNPFAFEFQPGAQDVIFYGPEAEFVFRTNNATFPGSILGKKVSFENPITILGSVTAHTLTMKNGVVINRPGGNDCTQPPNNYTLELAPSSDIGLTCETLTPTVRVLNNGVLATDFTGSVTVRIDGVDQQLTPVNGVLEQILSLTVNQTKTVAVEAYINGDQANTTVTGQYQFVPFKFAIDDQYVIAAKPQPVNAKVLACNAGEVVDIGYNGTINPTSTLEQPNPGVGVLDYTPIFAAGVSNTDLTFSDSGVVRVQLEDGNFDCTGVQGCPIEGSGILKGQFYVYSRPWTFAICNAPDAQELKSGDAIDGDSFVAAGESFSAIIKPIAWGGSEGQEDPNVQIETTQALCDEAIVTQNFSMFNAPITSIALASQLASPAGGRPGDFTDVIIPHYPSHMNGMYRLDALNWSEVGSLKLYTSTTDYLGQKVNIGYRNVGRFYPAYFSIDKTQWIVPRNQGEAAYLDQPYERVDVEVYPYNSAGQKVRNYSLIAEKLQVKYSLVGEYSDRISGFNTDVSWRDDGINSAVWKLDLTNVIFSRLKDDPSSTKEDGPFNTSDTSSSDTNLKLEIVSVDPATFSINEVVSEAELKAQPPARYGRMHLQDVGGHTGNKINVPLRVEYWDGNQFVTNGDDSGSDFDGSQFCRQVIWHSTAQTTSNASLSGSGTVAAGTAEQLFAQQSPTDINNEIREQVRFWLSVSDTALQKVDDINDNNIQCNGVGARPWLRFNWRNKGDEDPSAVVTFGINRGNDRVIYKGESGLTGQ
ncbi:DUF6701 domain-containing protein [Vibrio vulnificus]|uniref:DUF6701 domain-containing protein n=1 Tax=Vibrio vulnificus TaxID=672 RepID=UPI0019D465B4|nr:DUF6701 domain-containing protein [Vibrio vulnificus]MBN8104667.1 hypothetical protein [Vibrio vulnificus]